MTIRNDVKSVARELSPILAGFKLAVIVIGYFGFGSLAKWIIQFWYPFTRWVWDQITFNLSLPNLPNTVKDSLTAFVFFLPLGVTALLNLKNGNAELTSAPKRSFALFLGLLLLVIVCKDAVTEIASNFWKES